MCASLFHPPPCPPSHRGRGGPFVGVPEKNPGQRPIFLSEPRIRDSFPKENRSLTRVFSTEHRSRRLGCRRDFPGRCEKFRWASYRAGFLFCSSDVLGRCSGRRDTSVPAMATTLHRFAPRSLIAIMCSWSREPPSSLRRHRRFAHAAALLRFSAMSQVIMNARRAGSTMRSTVNRSATSRSGTWEVTRAFHMPSMTLNSPTRPGQFKCFLAHCSSSSAPSPAVTGTAPAAGFTGQVPAAAADSLSRR